MIDFLLQNNSYNTYDNRWKFETNYIVYRKHKITQMNNIMNII